MDKIMRNFGLSGKSVVPNFRTACAIPALQHEILKTGRRLITILVTPFTTCSARLPVYAIIIALVIRIRMSWGFFEGIDIDVTVSHQFLQWQ
jgi:ferrous iron transport protein B